MPSLKFLPLVPRRSKCGSWGQIQLARTSYGEYRPRGRSTNVEICRVLREEGADRMPYIGFIRQRPGASDSFIPKTEGRESMTYLEVVFNYGAIPGENEMRAIDAMREVYGIRRVQFNAKERTVRVEFDASRMKQDAVAKLLRNAGIDVREPVALA
jgi:hypothetical protein